MDIEKNLIQSFAKRLQQTLLPTNKEHQKMVQRGLMLFRQNRVHSVQQNGQKILSKVQDVLPVQTILNLEKPHLSFCTCPDDGLCRHQLATFFQIYSNYFPVSQWVDDWKNENKKLDFNIFGSYFRQETTHRSERQNPPTNLYDSIKMEAAEIFQSVYSKKEVFHPVLISLFANNAFRRLDETIPENRELKSIYQIIIYLHFFHLLLEKIAAIHTEQEVIQDRFEPVVETILSKIKVAIDNFPKPTPFQVDPLLERLQIDVRNLLHSNGPFHFSRLLLYWWIWSSLMWKSSWREEELKITEKEVKENHPFSLAMVTNIFQLFLTNQVDTALQRIEEKGLDYFFIYDFFIEYCSISHNWKAMEKVLAYYLRYIRPYMQGLSKRHIENHMDWLETMIYKYANETGRFDMYEKVMNEMLPHSFDVLIRFYFNQKKYRKFVNLLHFENIGIEALENDLIRTLQKEEPTVLLPLYHWSIVREIEEKKRVNYRTAVRYLKKLRTLYKKLNKEKEWERYLEKLLTEYKRLRVFREECQRSNLIHG